MSRSTRTGGRLGVYVDDVYRIVDEGSGASISTDRAFLLFVHEVGRHFERLVLFGRAVDSDTPADYVLPSDVELVSLPHYSSLADVGDVLRAALGTLRTMWRGLSQVDVVWVFGPHPFAVVLVLLAVLRRRRVVLGVRQDTIAYFRARLQGRRPLLLRAVRALDLVFRALARRLPTAAVGAAIAQQYGGGRAPVVSMTVTLVRRGDISAAPKRDWTGPIRLLTVSRIEPEKNPALLIQALARLQQQHADDFQLTWIGRGALEPDIVRLARALDVAAQLKIRGYVPFGSDLLQAYRDAHVFVHVSLTEGVPQVLIEALAAGTPVVATDVGGVGGTLDDGRLALLVPPDDLDALVEAITRICQDVPLRERLISRGLAFARAHTLEEEAGRVAFLLGSANVVRSGSPERSEAPANDAGAEADV